MNKKTWLILAGLYAAGLLCGLIVLARRPAPAKLSLDGMPHGSFSRNNIAVVEIYGPIYTSQQSSRFGFMRGADRIVRQLHKLNESPNIKAVVLRVNSPGGSVGAVQEICTEIAALRKNKKIVVTSMGDICASGGYYIASQSDSIVANPGSLTGSIGVIMEVANVQELFKKVGLDMVTIRSGIHKDIGSPFRQLTPEERTLLQGLINDSYNQFVDAVAQGRKLDRAKVIPIADGRIFTGNQAKARGLVDEFGSSMDAVAIAAKMANIKSPKVVYESEAGSIFEALPLFGSSSEIKIMPQFVSERKIRLDYMLE